MKVIDLTNAQTQMNIATRFHNRLGYDRDVESNIKTFAKFNEIRKYGEVVKIESKYNVDLSLMDSDY